MICGADEAGRGPVIGPLVVAGILVENDSELVRIG
ncbi:MAG TPA: ribonuclease HII, partial [Thermoplasmata archaeon]